MRLTIHQPECAPWLGFFHKASLADVVLLLDDVQFRKNYFQNRNRILTAKGPEWITVPIEHAGLNTPINQVKIAWQAKPNWAEGFLDKIRQSYQQAPFFEDIGFFLQHRPERLVDLNIPLIEWMAKKFGLAASFSLSSTLGISSSGSQRILELCQRMGATTYLSGISGRDYLDLESFRAAGIDIEFQDFHHPIYKQTCPNFVPQLSALEALFLFGPHTASLLRADWPQKMATAFV